MTAKGSVRGATRSTGPWLAVGWLVCQSKLPGWTLVDTGFFDAQWHSTTKRSE